MFVPNYPKSVSVFLYITFFEITKPNFGTVLCILEKHVSLNGDGGGGGSRVSKRSSVTLLETFRITSTKFPRS